MNPDRDNTIQSVSPLIEPALELLKEQSGVTKSAAQEEFIREVSRQKTELEAYGFENRHNQDFQRLAEYRADLFLGRTRQGLMLIGFDGNGKTLAIKSFRRSKFYRTRDLVRIFKNDPEFWDRIKNGVRYDYADRSEMIIEMCMTIDDLGIEPTLNDYGTKDEIMNEIIEARYDLWISHGARTLFTTNMPPLESCDGLPAIKERYGLRTWGRINEMCKVIIFHGPNQR